MEINEKIKIEPAAIVLEAPNASGDPNVTEVTWDDLRSAPIGTEWRAKALASLFSIEETARLLYRDERYAVVVRRSWNERVAADGRVERADNETLHVLRFRGE